MRELSTHIPPISIILSTVNYQLENWFYFIWWKPAFNRLVIMSQRAILGKLCGKCEIYQNLDFIRSNNKILSTSRYAIAGGVKFTFFHELYIRYFAEKIRLVNHS